MIFLIIACSFLAVGFAYLLIKLILMRKDLRQMAEKLKTISLVETNAQVRTQTGDKSIIHLAKGINASISKHRENELAAERSENELKRAMTNISHDLRTPLTAARGYLQMLQKEDLSAETRENYLGIVDGRLDSLSILLDNLFAYTRISEGSKEMDLQQVNIANPLRDVLSENYMELEKRDFQVEVTIPETPVYCLCDYDALQRVLQNLFRNVYLHGKDYLSVSIEGTAIIIANHVEHIEDIKVDNIFERFYTADASRNNKNTGIGLAIAKELMRQMGGELSASQAGDKLIMRVELAS